jgi:serine/threonine protein kinase
MQKSIQQREEAVRKKISEQQAEMETLDTESGRMKQKITNLKTRDVELARREEERKAFVAQEPVAPLPQVVFTIHWSELKILGEIGHGTYASVYKAMWRGDEVAVKKIKYTGNTKAEVEILLQSFEREALTLSKVRHPNIVLLMAACMEPPNLAMVTELMEGDLFTLIHRSRRPLSWEQRLQIAIDVARATNYLHSLKRPIVHRDLKSQNVLLDRTGRAKISDFGLVRVKEHTCINTTHAAGTPAWMAPECLRGEDFDEKSDIFSFGCICWELLMGKIPWEHTKALDVISRVGFCRERLPLPLFPPPGCPAQLLQLIRDCMEEEPFERPDFATIINDLTNMLEMVQQVAEEPSVPEYEGDASDSSHESDEGEQEEDNEVEY